MKKFFCSLFALLFFFTGVAFVGKQFSDKPVAPTDEKETMKAIWISQYDIKNVLVSRQKTEVRRMLGVIFDNCVSLGFDTVILQVRPNGDSLYPSEIFAPSAYAVGEYGGEFSYDPFAAAVELARERGLSVHAWINPLRLMKPNEIVKIDPHNILRRWYAENKYIVEHEGRLYLDPAYPEVRDLIADGALEVARKYDIDGVHMDDYFYPHGISENFDNASYSMFGGALSLPDFRRENITKLVQNINVSLKSYSPDLIFGISPGGNLETLFNTDYADVEEWCRGGYLDYLCPQIYFGMEHETHAFDEVYLRWRSISRSENVELFVGITFGKAENASMGIGDKYAGTGKNEWLDSRRVLADCLDFLKENGEPDGIFVFCYQYFFDPVSGEKNKKTEEELDNFLPVWKDF